MARYTVLLFEEEEPPIVASVDIAIPVAATA